MCGLPSGLELHVVVQSPCCFFLPFFKKQSNLERYIGILAKERQAREATERQLRFAHERVIPLEAKLLATHAKLDTEDISEQR